MWSGLTPRPALTSRSRRPRRPLPGAAQAAGGLHEQAGLEGEADAHVIQVAVVDRADASGDDADPVPQRGRDDLAALARGRRIHSP